VHWRAAEEIPPATTFISSPHDLDAHYAKKRTTQWVGYKVHITETCEDDLPHLVTQVETMTGPIADGDATPVIHDTLARRGLLPRTHLVDTGYLDAELLVSSRLDYAVDLFGPTRANRHWQARAGEGFDIQHFRVDWERQIERCVRIAGDQVEVDAVRRAENPGQRRVCGRVSLRCGDHEPTLDTAI